MNPVIDSSSFKAVLKLAKSHVLQERRYEITVQDFLIGTLLACNKGEHLGLETATKEKLQNLRNELHLPTSTLDANELCKTDEPLSVCLSLRKLLSKNAEMQHFDQVVLGCIASFEENVRLDKSLICFGCPDQDMMRQLWEVCSSVKNTTGQSCLDADIIAVSLKIASASGVLNDHPIERAKIEGHGAGIACIQQERGWLNIPETLDAHNNEPEYLSLAPDLRQSLKDIGKTDDPLLFVVNIALTAAQKVVELERTAYHEAGHTVASLVLRPDVKIIELSIVPKPGSDGRVAFEEIAFRRHGCASRDGIHDEILISLAGRVAEQKKFGFGSADAGATHDLKRATTSLWTAITEYGLDPEFGPINLSALSEASTNRTAWLHEEAEKRLQRLLKIAHSECVQLINDHWASVELLAGELFKHKTLSEDAIRQTCAVPSVSDVMHRSSSHSTIFSHGVSNEARL